MTKPMVPSYKEMFWSSSWLDILIASRISEIFDPVSSEKQKQKIGTTEAMDKDFLLCYTEDETVK